MIVLRELLERGLVTRRTELTGGRNTERWFAVTPQDDVGKETLSPARDTRKSGSRYLCSRENPAQLRSTQAPCRLEA